MNDETCMCRGIHDPRGVDRSRCPIHQNEPVSVPTESRPALDARMDWAYRAAERIHLLYRDANYFKSMPKAPLIEGWAEIICTEFFKSPPVMFGFKTVEDWEKFTKFAASSVLLPVGRQLSAEQWVSDNLEHCNCGNPKHENIGLKMYADADRLGRFKHLPTGRLLRIHEICEAYAAGLPVGRQLEAEELLREVLLEYGVRSGECRTCDQLNGKHLDCCIIQKIETFLARGWQQLGEDTEA